MGDEGNAGVDLHSTTGEPAKNGKLPPSKSTNAHCISTYLRNDRPKVAGRDVRAISEGASVGIVDWCHRWRAVAPTLSTPDVTC